MEKNQSRSTRIDRNDETFAGARDCSGECVKREIVNSTVSTRFYRLVEFRLNIHDDNGVKKHRNLLSVRKNVYFENSLTNALPVGLLRPNVPTRAAQRV